MPQPSKPLVLIVCDKSPHTSFGRICLDMVVALSSTFSVEPVWLTSPQYFPKGAPDVGNPIPAAWFPLGYLTWRPGLWSLLRRKKPAWVVLIRPELGFLAPLVRKASAKVSTFVHDMFAETLYPDSRKFRFINRYWVAPMAKSHGFLFNSNYTAEETHAHFGRASVETLVGCPVHANNFPPPVLSKSELKRKYVFDPQLPLVLNISLDEPRKNVSTFLAMAKARPNATFVRVGPNSEAIRNYMKEQGIGNVHHRQGLSLQILVDFYGMCDLFVYPSLLEGFGMPPLEALAAGAQVVSSGTSAMGENLHGVCPLVLPADDLDGYLQAFDTIAAGKTIVDRSKANELLERFTLERFGERLLLHWQELLKIPARTAPTP